MNIIIRLAILTSTLMNIIIPLAILIIRLEPINLADTLLLGFPPYEHHYSLGNTHIYAYEHHYSLGNTHVEVISYK